ncbi:MAG: hypothetical protein ABSG41_16800 [Bryobacteraceae bacterium]|jgi:hypothetical protein
MPHLRLEVAEEWLREEFKLATGFDAKKLLDHLVQVVAGLRMEKPGTEARLDAEGKPIAPEMVPMINLSNLKHAIVPLYYAHVAGDPSKRFLHVTLSAGNDTPGRTAAVRLRASQVLGDEVDKFMSELPALAGLLASVTTHVLDIDRDRGYSTTAERRKKRDAAKVN